MNNAEAKATHRKCLAALGILAVRNLMEHAANETPILNRKSTRFWFCFKGAG